VENGDDYKGTCTLFQQRVRLGRQPSEARATIIDFYLPGDVVTRRKSRQCRQPDDPPARDEWVLLVGSAAVAGTDTIGPPRPGYRKRVLCPALWPYNVFTRSALASVAHRSPAPPTAVYAHTRMIVVPGRSTPSAPISRLVYIIFGFFFPSFSRFHVSLVLVATSADNCSPGVLHSFQRE